MAGLTAEPAGDTGGAVGDAGETGGEGPAAAGGPAGGAPAGGEGTSGTVEFTLDMIANKTPAELTADEGLAKDPNIAKFKTVDDLLRSHVSAQKMVGNPDAFVKLPTEASTDEERAEFFARLGRPEKPDGYQFREPEGLPEGMPEPNEDLINGFRNAAFEAGAPAELADRMYQWFRQQEASAVQARQESLGQAAQQAERALRAEWGAAYAEKFAAAERVVDEQPEAFAAKLRETGLANDADMVKLLAQIGESKQEDSDPRLGGSQSGTMTPGQAQAEVARLRSDPAFTKSWMDKMDPGHQAAVDKMNALYALIYPEGT